jgi:hypothetical protein
MPQLRLLALVVGLSAVGCGSVKPAGSGDDSGSDAGTDTGGVCVSSDQCAAPAPVCDVGTGCVECLQNDQCSADKPTCDTAMHTCRTCSVDADCDSDVCDLETGACVAEAKVLYTSPTGADAGTCPKGTPCSIVQAAALADQTRNNIKLAPGAYSAHIMLTNKTLSLFGVGATISGQTTNQIFDVDDGAQLRLVGVTLSATSSLGVIRCEGDAAATHVVDMFQTTIANNNTILLANPCTMSIKQSVLQSSKPDAFTVAFVGPSIVTIDRSRIVGAGSGIAGVSNATINITNSVITNMNGSANHGALVGSTFNVSFTTFVNSYIECSNQGTVGLTLDSSIVTNPGAASGFDAIQGVPACTSIKFTLAFPSVQPVGATNLVVDPQLKDIAANDFHLKVTSPALDHGDPASTIAIDFDGVARPQGANPDSGAFEFKP